jgi:hypothetical protein
MTMLQLTAKIAKARAAYEAWERLLKNPGTHVGAEVDAVTRVAKLRKDARESLDRFIEGRGEQE